MLILLKEFRYALRALRLSPSFAAAALVALALGIGVNTSVFSIFNAIFLRPLELKNADDLVRVFRHDPTGTSVRFSYPAYVYYKDHASSLANVIAFTETSVVMNGGSPGADNKSLSLGGSGSLALIVSGNYFQALNVQAIVGRVFRRDGDVVGSTPVAVLSHSFWERRFGGDRTIIGRDITLNRAHFIVIGVASPNFCGTELRPPDLWIPLATRNLVMPGQNWLEKKDAFDLQVMGRLRPGVSITQAKSELPVLEAQIARLIPEEKDASISVSPATLFPEPQSAAVKTALALMQTAVSMVLLIACANVANLLLARSTIRQKEIAIRLAIGATRWRLMRQLLVESLVLAIGGALIGLVLAYWACRLLSVVMQNTLQAQSFLIDLSPDWRVLTYSLILSVVTALIFGLIPSLKASRPDMASILKGDSTDFERSLSRGWLKGGIRELFLIGQVTTSMVLLITASLLVRGMMKVQSEGPGFETSHIVAIRSELRDAGYDESKAEEFARQLTTRLQMLPSVKSTALAANVPLGSYGSMAAVVAEGVPSTPDHEVSMTYVGRVSRDFFSTFNVPVIRGRIFTSSETESDAPIAVISTSMAQRLWPNQDAIGKRFKIGNQSQFREVVGIARDIRSHQMHLDESRVYLPSPLRDAINSDVGIYVRGVGDLQNLLVQAGVEARKLDSNVSVVLYRLDDLMPLLMIQSRGSAGLASLMGLLAMALTVIGIYGVTAYSISKRTREIGIRMALGSEPQEVLRVLLSQGMRPVLVGIILGLASTVLLWNVLSSLLFGISELDPLALAVATMGVVGVALLAIWIPVRRAIKIDPILALRHS